MLNIKIMIGFIIIYVSTVGKLRFQLGSKQMIALCNYYRSKATLKRRWLGVKIKPLFK